MLYFSHITHDVAKNEDKLVEQLYIFLRNYVPSRIKYEDDQTKDDCIQSTIMFMLKRFNDLKATEQLDEDFNYERYFFNRARSYISLWLRNLSKDRKNQREYIEYYHYLLQPEKTIEHDLIDVQGVYNIIKAYNLTPELEEALNANVISKLIDLGYYAIPTFIPNLGKEKNQFLETLSYVIVDEYLINDAKVKVRTE